MNSWPQIARCLEAQWRGYGLKWQDTISTEWVEIAEGKLRRVPTQPVRADRTIPIWQAAAPLSPILDLIAVKCDCDPVRIP